VNESISQYTFGELTEDTAYEVTLRSLVKLSNSEEIYSEETKEQTRTSPGRVTVGPLSPPGTGK